MADEKKEQKGKPTGMWNCVMTGKTGKKGEKRVYHASTAETLEKKGFLKKVDEIEIYEPKGVQK